MVSLGTCALRRATHKELMHCEVVEELKKEQAKLKAKTD